MDRRRETALKTLETGSQMQLVKLYMADTDRNDNNRKDEHYKPLLTEEERQSIIGKLDNKTYHTLESKVYYYNIVLDAFKVLENAAKYIRQTREELKYWQHSWALTEQLETSVNVALLQIEDQDRRTATAMGIAKRLQILGYCQSIDPDGMLILNPKVTTLKTDAAKKIRDLAIAMYSYIGEFKGMEEAIQEAVKYYRLEMPATKHNIDLLVKDMRSEPLPDKYEDKPQMNTNIPPEEIDHRGEPLLYEPYRLMKNYDDVPASRYTKNMALEYYLLIK